MKFSFSDVAGQATRGAPCAVRKLPLHQAAGAGPMAWKHRSRLVSPAALPRLVDASHGGLLST